MLVTLQRKLSQSRLHCFCANCLYSAWVCTSLTNKRQSDRQYYLPDICTVNAYIGALPDRLVFLHAKPMKPCKWWKLQVPTLLAFLRRPNGLANRSLCQHWVNFHKVGLVNETLKHTQQMLDSFHHTRLWWVKYSTLCGLCQIILWTLHFMFNRY